LKICTTLFDNSDVNVEGSSVMKTKLMNCLWTFTNLYELYFFFLNVQTSHNRISATSVSRRSGHIRQLGLLICYSCWKSLLF